MEIISILTPDTSTLPFDPVKNQPKVVSELTKFRHLRS